jgi:hypothetical protein
MDERRMPRASDSGQRLFDDAAVARGFQRRLRDARPAGRYGRQTLQYDESGYPIDGRTTLADRVRRLITG